MFTLKLVVAVYAMGVLLWWMAGASSEWLTAGAWSRVTRLALLVLAGAGSYFGVLWLLGFRWRDFNRRS